MRIFPALLALLLLAVPTAAQTPYAGTNTRQIKALSGTQVSELQNGRGMGMALAAELNGYPGPLHVIELAEELSLSSAQRFEVQRLFNSMKAEAVSVGARLIEGETALDQLFASQSATEEKLKAITTVVAATQGTLRETHLKYHLATKATLTEEQVKLYGELRGYGGSGSRQRMHHQN